jgi:hypothetical protein
VSATRYPRAVALWLIPIGMLLAYGGYVTDWGRKLLSDDIAWRKVSAPQVSTGVVPDIAFNADASPYAAITDRNLFVPWRKPAPPPEPPKAPAANSARGVCLDGDDAVR